MEKSQESQTTTISKTGSDKSLNRVAVIGNGGGGKTTLSRKLSESYNLPLTHVDSIQYLPGMEKRDEADTRAQLNALSEQKFWIIDGFGPMDVMQSRFLNADKVLFIDFPLWRHYWWCTKRQIKSIANPRTELPENCNEATLSHTWRLYKILWRVHRQLRPQFVEFFSKSEMTGKVEVVRNLKDWNRIYQRGFND